MTYMGTEIINMLNSDFNLNLLTVDAFEMSEAIDNLFLERNKKMGTPAELFAIYKNNKEWANVVKTHENIFIIDVEAILLRQ